MIMARKKISEEEEKEFENKLSEVEFVDSQSKIKNEVIDLLKQIVDQNYKVIQLLTNLKDRFV